MKLEPFLYFQDWPFVDHLFWETYGEKIHENNFLHGEISKKNVDHIPLSFLGRKL